jgi:DNA-binding winged helix-turn-helix (wHTH) protein/TolB-like protein
MANGRDRLAGIYCFDHFTLDMHRGVLVGADGEEVPLRPKSFAFLLFMLEHAGCLVSREAIMEALWSNIYVTDDSLTQCVHDVRHALGNESRHLLRTITGRGYIFNPEVVRQEPEASSQVTALFHRRALPNGNEPTHIPDEGIRRRFGSEGSIRMSVLVLPLRSLYGSDAQERLAQSVTGDVVTDLDRCLKQLAAGEAKVLFHTDQLAQPRTTRDEQADYVLCGGVQGPHRPTVNLQLLNAMSGVCLWAERCELDSGPGVIARLMFAASMVLVRDVGRRVEALLTLNLTPHELMLRGRAWLLRPASPAYRYQALCCFERALALQPDLIGAKLGIAGSLIYALSNGWSHTIEYDEARAEALMLDAIQVDTDTAVTHSLLGTLRRLQGRLDESRIELELATDAAPHIGMAASQLGMTLLYCGQPEVALPHFEAGVRAAGHDLQRPLLLSNLGTGRILLGDIDRAVEVLREATAADPQHSVPPLMLAAALALKSDPAEASATLRRAVELCPSWGTLSGLRNWVSRQARPDLMPIYEYTLERGLRRAGMPEV